MNRQTPFGDLKRRSGDGHPSVIGSDNPLGAGWGKRLCD